MHTLNQGSHICHLPLTVKGASTNILLDYNMEHDMTFSQSATSIRKYTNVKKCISFMEQNRGNEGKE